MPEGYLGISTNPTVNMLGHMMHELSQHRDVETSQRKPKYLFDVANDTNKALSNISRRSTKKSMKNTD